MEVCLFLMTQENAQQHGRFATEDLLAHAQAVEGLLRLIVHRPTHTRGDPRIADAAESAAIPACVLQWYFDDLTSLEAAASRGGPIWAALTAAMGEPASQAFAQQTLAVRRYTSAAPQPQPDTMRRCSYLVAYEGPADDFDLWLAHYLAHHPALMMRLPGLSELEIYTRVDSVSGLPFPVAVAMQRNKVVFDDTDALDAALASPVRDAMREDFHALPAYQGATPHFPMDSFYGNLTGT